MKRILSIALITLLALTAGACARHKIIPDRKLALIFHDAFLANAYISNEGLRVDSLNIYEPIFARYGYTTDDVQYTIGNFSKRKSARLGDVVEEAIALLEKEGEILNHEVAVLDTVDNVARRTFTRTLLSDSLIRVRSLRDTAQLRFTFDVDPGDYKVSLNYRIDSMDRNEGALRGVMWLERADSTRTNTYYHTMRRNRDERLTRTFTADSSHRRLRIDLMTFTSKPRQPSLTVRDFSVEYTPPTAAAVDSLYSRQLNIRIFADEFLRAIDPADSL